jgi:hypothetical protein
LLGLQYRIIYWKGANNGAANSLSRAPHATVQRYRFASPSGLMRSVNPMCLMKRCKTCCADCHLQQIWCPITP